MRCRTDRFRSLGKLQLRIGFPFRNVLQPHSIFRTSCLKRSSAILPAGTAEGAAAADSPASWEHVSGFSFSADVVTYCGLERFVGLGIYHSAVEFRDCS